MSKLFRYGGVAASIVLIAFGIGSIVVGLDGRAQVRDDLARERIVGTPDSTIPNQKVDTGSEARAFAAVMRKHTLEATGGQTYAQMGQFLDDNGKPMKRGEVGALVARLPMPPGTFPTLWQAEQRFKEAYLTEYPGYYKTGDAGVIDDDGYVSVMTRVDDVINVAGHRLSTGQIE